jgi:preprotein translocase subunit YajC
VLIIKPQRRRQVAQRRMVDDLEVGAEILTVGGLFGHVRAIEGNEVHVEIAPGTTVRMAMRAIATVVSPEEENGKSAEDDELEPGPSVADEPDSTRANGG